MSGLLLDHGRVRRLRTLDLERLVPESPLIVGFRGVTRGIEAPNLVRL
jgi:hypothetical protein